MEVSMLRIASGLLLVSMLFPACKNRDYLEDANSNNFGNSGGMITIHVESVRVSQPMIFASVDPGIGECRGGNPKSIIRFAPGSRIPELNVAVGTKAVCIAGQAGGGGGGGQDIKYFDLPPNLRGGEVLIIRNDQVVFGN
jgi:hypothetical protein